MAVFTNKDVTEHMGIPARLVQFYTKEGVIKPADGGGGRGQPWVYEKENLIDFGILRELTCYGMTLPKVKKFFDFFRKPPPGFPKGWDRYRRRVLRSGGEPLDSYLFLFYNIETDEVDVVHHPGADEPVPTKEEREKHDSWIVINIGRIIAKVESL
jgi:DNA-binding transcriptional MerR regulator